MDSCKVFVSRIPQTFTEDSIKRIFEEQFGDGCVLEVSIAQERVEDGDGGREYGYGTSAADVDEKDKQQSSSKSGTNKDDTKHRGFGFVTFSNESTRDAAIEAGTVRGSAKTASKRKHTLYIRPVVREGEEEHNSQGDAAAIGNKNICFLWKKHRCPYGDTCKFVHEGEGGCLVVDEASKKKKQKCFAFKKSGKCKLGDECPFSHDVAVMSTGTGSNKKSDESAIDTKANDDDGTKPSKAVSKDKSLKDCINWKNKGKCRKGEKCPYRHDEAIRKKVLAKKKGKDDDDGDDNTRKRDNNKIRQTLSIRVFGLNYDTTTEDIQKFFSSCGQIMEITFPTFEDSGRSKGYCGVLFTSPKSVQKAIELDGSELAGRWLSIQEGKMYLRKWGEVEKTREEVRKKKYEEENLVGEYGQKVKKRKQHGFKE